MLDCGMATQTQKWNPLILIQIATRPINIKGRYQNKNWDIVIKKK